MKKGFTLIELLAVIVVIGIIAVIIVPKVNSTLKDSREKTSMAAANGLLKSAQYKYQDNEMRGISESIVIDYAKGTNTDELDFNGEKPTSGQVVIKSNGDIAMAVRIKDNCYLKNYKASEITSIPYNASTCDANANVFASYETSDIVTTGEGLYESTTNAGRLIYRGSNPNNYIWLDENGDGMKTSTEMYRIISYETDGTVKVIRNNSIGNYAYDTAGARYSNGTTNTYCTSNRGCNVWGNGNNTFSNGTALGSNFHYTTTDFYDITLTVDSQSGTVNSDATLNTYLNVTWLNGTSLGKYIDTHEFNVGAIKAPCVEEKGFTVEKEEESSLKWSGKIGLPNITEYVEASLDTNCISVMDAYRDMNNPPHCVAQNWLYNMLGEYESPNYITPKASSPDSYFSINYDGEIAASPTSEENTTYPVFYLKATVVLSGTGTEADPFTII